MAKIWDSLMKRLMQASPQDLVSWVFPDGVYEGELNTELHKEPILADLMYTIKWKGRQMVLHVEFQKRHDTNMGRRVWDYNVSICVRTGLPVYSVVIYLTKDNAVVEPPYTVDLPSGDIIHHFVFQNVKLWEIPPGVLIEQNLLGLLPLLPLTQEGNRREVVELMMSHLQQIGRKELTALGYAFSFLTLEQEIDQQWLKESFMNIEDRFEETWLYQYVMQKGEKKGITEGRAEGRAEALRDMLIHLTTLRFPNLVSQAQKQVEQANSQEQLQAIIDKLVTATTDQEARKVLGG